MILAASKVGFPLSTTHTISGAVIGSGAAKRLSAVRWGVAGNIIVAWVLTLPAAALFGALTYSVTRLFGTGAAGPLIVLGLILAGDRPLVRPPGPAAGARPGAKHRGGLGMIGSIVDTGALLEVIWVSLARASGLPPSTGSRSSVQRARSSSVARGDRGRRRCSELWA